MFLLEWLRGKRRWVNVPALPLCLTGEQDGPAERVLKAQLTGVLGSYPGVSRAYLARARYAREEPESVVLAVRLEAGARVALMDDVVRTFKGLFGPTEQLDVLFLNAEQDQEVAVVCAPFFPADNIAPL